MSSRYRLLLGAGLAVAAGLCFSSGGFFVRSVSLDAWEIIFLRCLFAVPAMLVYLLARERGNALAVVRAVSWPSVAGGVCTAWAIIAYVTAIQLTLVANVIAIMTTSTVIVALLAKPLLHERVALRTWLAMIGSLCGIGVMFSGTAGAGGLYGNLLAFTIALAIGGQTLLARRYRQVQMAPAVLIAAFIAGVVALPLALPLEASGHDLFMMAAFGIVQLSLSLVLYFTAARYIPAPTLIFVVLIDAVFAPLWVWLGFDEVPGTLAFIGAAVILGSIAINAALGLYALRGTLRAANGPS